MFPRSPAPPFPAPGSRVWTWGLALLLVWPTAPAAAVQARLRASPAESSLPGEGALLPVTWWCDYPLAEVRIEGRGPFHFLVDTGAAISAVDLDLAQLFPGRLARTRLGVLGARGEEVPATAVMALGELRLGDWAIEGLDALVLDLEPASEALRVELDGVLGYPAFAGLLLELDYPARSVRVRPGRLPEADGRGVLELLSGPIPRLALALGGGTVAVTLDSGSGGGLDLEAWPAGADFLSGPVEDLGLLTVGGLGPPRAVARLALDLDLGRHRVHHPMASVTGGEARLGAGLMRHFRWTFDPAARRVRLERAGEGPIEVESLRSSGLALILRGGELVVLAVLPASPAERAGVRAGDRLLALSGHAAAELTSCEGLRELVGRSSVLRAELERDGERLELAWDVVVQVP